MSCRKNDMIYRWQDVACCPEHGTQYLSEIIASRSEDAQNDNTADMEDKESNG